MGYPLYGRAAANAFRFAPAVACAVPSVASIMVIGGEIGPRQPFVTLIMMLDKVSLAEALKNCSMADVVKGLDDMTSKVQVLWQLLDDFREELMHLLRNPPPEWQWVRERTMCLTCFTTADSVPAAVDTGWTGIQKSADALDFRYIGTCPECSNADTAKQKTGRADTAGRSSEASAMVNEALTELLNCAELHQDDIEDGTRALVEGIPARLTAATDSIACVECDALSPTLTAAVERGWRDLQVDFHGKGRYRGFCPDCHEKEVEREFEEAEQRRRGRITENKTLFDC